MLFRRNQPNLPTEFDAFPGHPPPTSKIEYVERIRAKLDSTTTGIDGVVRSKKADIEIDRGVRAETHRQAEFLSAADSANRSMPERTNAVDETISSIRGFIDDMAEKPKAALYYDPTIIRRDR